MIVFCEIYLHFMKSSLINENILFFSINKNKYLQFFLNKERIYSKLGFYYSKFSYKRIYVHHSSIHSFSILLTLYCNLTSNNINDLKLKKHHFA
jgi:hypothetical protein